MTRTEYLAQLDGARRNSGDTIIKKLWTTLLEYFDTGPENEAQVIRTWILVKPHYEIMVNLLDIIEEDEPKNTKNVIQIAILSILAKDL